MSGTTPSHGSSPAADRGRAAPRVAASSTPENRAAANRARTDRIADGAPSTEPDAGGRRPIGVAVAITTTPEAWIVALLERVDRHPQLRLYPVLLDDERTPPRPTAPALAGRVARLVLHGVVDRPRFDEGARRPTPLPEALRARADDDAGIANADVLLELDGPRPLLERRLAPGASVWSTGAERLESRVERALLERAPLLWLHLWRRAAGAPPESAERLASHALPRQSFSVSDLLGAALLALPALCVSRLGWLAHGRDPLAQERASLPGPGDEADGRRPIAREQERAARDASDALLLAARRRPPRDATGLGSLALLGGALTLLARQTLASLERRLGEEQWQLGVVADPGGTDARGVLARLAASPVDAWQTIEPPPGRSWADPHLCRRSDEVHVFFEELESGAERAHVCALRLDARGRPIEAPRRVLVAPFHLSYPFVFEHEGRHYLLPETAARHRVSLYTTERYPDGWYHLTDLLVDVDLADATLHRHAGLWWLFANRFTHRSVDERDELVLHFAETLEGPWHAHPLNPVVTGVDRARMAGGVFVDGAHRFRPSQYGAHRYGYGINLARIDALTPEDYRETPLARVVPPRGSRWRGCHTLTSAASLSVRDRVVYRRRRRGPRGGTPRDG